MGVEYGLYIMDKKEYIWLGKIQYEQGEAKGYQISPDKIAKFLARHMDGVFLILPDTGNLPEEDELGWVIKDHWSDESDEEE